MNRSQLSLNLMIFLLERIISCTQLFMFVLLGYKAFQLDTYSQETTLTPNFRVSSFQAKHELYAKYMNSMNEDQFYWQYILIVYKLESAVSFVNLFYTFLQGQIVFMKLAWHNLLK